MSDRDLDLDTELADLDQLAEYDLYFEDEGSDLAEDIFDEAPFINEHEAR